MSANPIPPASQLTGMSLENEWNVIKPVSSATGGCFSYGYIVENRNGREAFLKALDYSRALEAENPAEALNVMTKAYLFERDLLFKCKQSNLNRVVQPIEEGTVTIPGDESPVSKVQYIIFELADSDVRKHLDLLGQFDVTWVLRCLHHVATGLHQLHRRNMAHQDLKPSNILVFEDGDTSKIADLGRGAYKGREAPHDTFTIAGDPTYSPPEFLYDYVLPDWNARRMGCDLYHLGSMINFFFTGVGMTASVLRYLDPQYHHLTWSSSYKSVLPYVREAFGLAVRELEVELPKLISKEITVMVRQLCDPNPELRGHPRNHRAKGNSYSLERYVSKLNLLTRRTKIKMAELSN